jgi:hypothetical protein
VCTVCTLSVLVQISRNQLWRLYTDDAELGAMMADNFFVMGWYHTISVT